jgi:hypothetical protein
MAPLAGREHRLEERGGRDCSGSSHTKSGPECAVSTSLIAINTRTIRALAWPVRGCRMTWTLKRSSCETYSWCRRERVGVPTPEVRKMEVGSTMPLTPSPVQRAKDSLEGRFRENSSSGRRFWWCEHTLRSSFHLSHTSACGLIRASARNTSEIRRGIAHPLLNSSLPRLRVRAECAPKAECTASRAASDSGSERSAQTAK